MTTRIDLASEVGEGFGLYEIAPDEQILSQITSAHVAGGFHAGDPTVMDETVRLAADHGVEVGVHPGLPDRVGFGRRRVDATPEEVAADVTYQIGALQAVAARRGVRVRYVKPHGALYAMLTEEERYARAALEAIHAVDEDLIFVPVDPQLYEIARDSPVRTALEGYVDLDYDETGQIIVPEGRNPGLDPETVAERFVRIATEGTVEARDGSVLDVPAQTVCVHGDHPDVLGVLEAIHRRAEEAGIELAPLADLT